MSGCDTIEINLVCYCYCFNVAINSICSCPGQYLHLCTTLGNDQNQIGDIKKTVPVDKKWIRVLKIWLKLIHKFSRSACVQKLSTVVNMCVFKLIRNRNNFLKICWQETGLESDNPVLADKNQNLAQKILKNLKFRFYTEWLVPVQTGNRTIKMYTSTDSILSVDHWPPKRKDMHLIIHLIILIILIILVILLFQLLQLF